MYYFDIFFPNVFRAQHFITWRTLKCILQIAIEVFHVCYFRMHLQIFCCVVLLWHSSHSKLFIAIHYTPFISMLLDPVGFIIWVWMEQNWLQTCFWHNLHLCWVAATQRSQDFFKLFSSYSVKFNPITHGGGVKLTRTFFQRLSKPNCLT